MTPERWRHVEDLFHSACELPQGEWDSFLARACDDDTALRQEVESLLAGRNGTLLAAGLGGAAAGVMPTRNGWEGRALGIYQLGSLIGVGGMGEVYRARDTKLGRDVAVKILPEALAGKERLGRFEREARILATLNHPNIAAIYGLEESAGVSALVLELVEGVTLAERLRTDAGEARALPLNEALSIARQIARGCEAAHQKGIVHRDLKPANIKIAPDGTVKILDFGVAKFETPREPGPNGSGVLATAEGSVIGTVAYMSPEQARGLTVDRRTDIWAFGCVLYEMLTGCRSFPGDSSADVLGAITSRDPDWTLLPAGTPARVRDLLRRCLIKDPERRVHDIADVRIEIDETIDGRSVAPLESSSRRWARTMAPWLMAGAVVAIAIATLWLRGPERRGLTRLSMELPPEVAVYAIGRGSSVAIAPDGQRVVYVAVAGDSTRLMTRPIGGEESTPVAGTKGATNPFFSPDGRWIGFLVNRSLMKVPAEGGVAIPIVKEANNLGAWWGDDGTIVYAGLPVGELWRVPSGGGSPQPVTSRADVRATKSWPQILPGGRSVLYTLWYNTSFEGGRIVVQPIDGGKPTVLVEHGSYGRVLVHGRDAYLVYARAEGLMAAPFDVATNRLLGDATLVQDGVYTNLSGGAHFSVTPDGVLAYMPGRLDEMDKTLLWVGRDGATTALPPIPGLGFGYRLSPDGKRIARPNASGGDRDLWIDDLTGRSASVHLTVDRTAGGPIWTPDGTRVIYSAGEPSNLHWRAADGKGDEQQLTSSPHSPDAGSVTPDGILVYSQRDPVTGFDLWMLPLNGPRTPQPFLATPRSEASPRTSPDGRWVAYQSNISGSVEVYVAPFPQGTPAVSVSQGAGGSHPMWSPDGRQLYFRRDPDNPSPNPPSFLMFVAPVDTGGPEAKVGTPRALSSEWFQGNGDVAPDGRLLLLKHKERAAPTRVIRLVFEWFDDLRAKVPRR